MIFSAFQREDDDSLFTVCKNASGAAINVGEPVAWDLTSVDGVRVSLPASNELSLFRGVATETFADGTYGKVQVGGYCSYAKVTNDTSQAIAAGNILIPVAASAYLAYSGASDGKSGFVYAAEAFATATTPAAAAKGVLLRAL
jgi:hypothetical protein